MGIHSGDHYPMSLFEEVGMSWKGKEYVVPSDRVMGLIDTIENTLTVEDLNGKVKRGLLAKAYCDALRYAGCRDVTQEDVYAVIYDFKNKEGVNYISQIATNLLMMMIPPDCLRQDLPDEEESKKKPDQELSRVS